MAKIHIPEGYVHVGGRSQGTAQELLKLAEEAGHKHDVATTSNGYIVLKEVAEAFSASPAKKAEEEMLAGSDSNEDGSGNADLFDPADHTVTEVNAYLADATEEERVRVLSAEKDGKARASLVENEEGAK